MASDLPPWLGGIAVPPGLLEALQANPLPNFVVRCIDGRIAGIVHPYMPDGKMIQMTAAMSVEDFDEFVTEGRSLPHRYEWHAAQRVIAAARDLVTPGTKRDHYLAGCEGDRWGWCTEGVACKLKAGRKDALQAALDQLDRGTVEQKKKPRRSAM